MTSSRPHRLGATRYRDLHTVWRFLVLTEVNFVPARLIGHIGHPATVRRELCPTCIKRPRDEFLGWVIALNRYNPHLCKSALRATGNRDLLAIRCPRRGNIFSFR